MFSFISSQVLRDSFNPKVVPRVRIWLNEAKADGWYLKLSINQ